MQSGVRRLATTGASAFGVAVVVSRLAAGCATGDRNSDTSGLESGTPMPATGSSGVQAPSGAAMGTGISSGTVDTSGSGDAPGAAAGFAGPARSPGAPRPRAAT